jgi:hypothetical protein
VRIASGLVFSLLLAGCLPANEPSADEPPALPARTHNDWIDCYRGFSPSEDPISDVERLATACAAPAGMKPLTPVHDGAEQGEHDQPERMRFRARRGRCYRVFAVGAPGVEDLDVAIYDADGKLAAADVSRDRWPVVPPRGPACADRDGMYTVAVAVTRGSGPYAMLVWGVDRVDGE